MHVLTPQMVCIAQFHHVIVDVKVHRMVGLAFEDNAVVARILQLRAKMPAGICRANSARERRLRHHFVTARRRRERARQGTRHKNQLVLGRKRVDLGVNLVAIIFRTQATRAHVIVGILHVQGLFCDGSRAQIDAKNSAYPGVSDSHNLRLLDSGHKLVGQKLLFTWCFNGINSGNGTRGTELHAHGVAAAQIALDDLLL